MGHNIYQILPANFLTLSVRILHICALDNRIKNPV